MTINHPDSPAQKKGSHSILFLGSQMETAGAQRMLLEQASWFNNLGWHVDVAFLYDKEGLHQRWQKQYPFPIYNLKARTVQGTKIGNMFRLIGGVWRAARLIMSYRFDVIETFTHHSNLVGIPLAWLAGIKVRVATHHGLFHGFGRGLQRIHAWMVNCGMASCLVAVSEQVCQQALSEGVNAKKVRVIRNGVRLPDIDAPAARARIRQEFLIGEDTRVALAVGRLQVEKGHSLLIEIIPEVISRVPNMVFWLAGIGSLRDVLENQVDSLGIRSQVRFLGLRQDIPDLMAAADLFVLPSRTEGMPGALLEAMGMGMAAVAFNISGVSEVIQHEKTGLLVPAEDGQALAQAIIRVFTDETERETLGVQAKHSIMDGFSLEKMCRHYEELFSNLYTERNRA
jgi:glycosyltransferase involved in cell wall biosynthesis